MRSAPTSADLLAWYDRHARVLPWRAPPGARAEPYRVWLSEVMLQQTTVKAVIPYFHRFLERWPRVRDLAAARDEDVMAAWAGLGYYARARKLLACARVVSDEYGGVFPDSEAKLRELPGVGPYTAAAIAAIAFGRRAVVVDGNVERVASRMFAIREPLPGAKTAIRAAVDTLTPDTRSGDFAQAMMDLGATICTPRKPACGLCPWRACCAGLATGEPESFPSKAVKPDRSSREGVAFLVHRQGCILLRRRPPRGLLGGMTEVPGSPWETNLDSARARRAPPIAGLSWREARRRASHVFTHFALEVVVLVADAPPETRAPEGYWWHPVADLDGAGLPTAMRKIVSVGLDEIIARAKA